MSEQVTLDRSEWENMLCPFEYVKKWKNKQGFTIKCPWISTQYRPVISDKKITRELKIKRNVDCSSCKDDMRRFLNGKSPLPNRWLPPFMRP